MMQIATSAPTAARVRELAVDYNRAYVTRSARYESVDIDATMAAIASGEAVILFSAELGHHGVRTLWANIAVRMSADSVVGEFAHAGEPVEIALVLKRGQTPLKMGQWWARKHFGTDLPLEQI
jgi:hypothetical protein